MKRSNKIILTLGAGFCFIISHFFYRDKDTEGYPDYSYTNWIHQNYKQKKRLAHYPYWEVPQAIYQAKKLQALEELRKQYIIKNTVLHNFHKKVDKENLLYYPLTAKGFAENFKQLIPVTAETMAFGEGKEKEPPKIYRRRYLLRPIIEAYEKNAIGS